METLYSPKILLILPFFYPHRGGSQKYAEELYASMMLSHPNVRVDVICYNTDKKASYEEYRGFRIYRVPCWNVIPARFALANPISLITALAKLSKNKYDFVNTHIRFFDPTWWVWLYAKIIGAKSIFTGHVATHPVHQNKMVEIVGKTVDLTIAALSLKFYDYITFTNKAAQTFFNKHLGVSKSSHIIYGGVDTTFFSPCADKSRRIIPNLGKEIPEGAVLITFVGRMIWTKGVTYLYEAAKQILQNAGGQNIYFVLAGPGELEKQLDTQITEDGLCDNILMTGNIAYEQVRDLLSMSDIFINPSHHNEGFPNTVLEAGASQCFVIATDNAGTAEVVINKQTGLIIPQKDTEAIKQALLWGINHAEERQVMALNMRKLMVDNFDWKIIQEQLYQLLTVK